MNNTHFDQKTDGNKVASDFGQNLDLDQILACPGCDLLLENRPVSPGHRLICPRCDEIIIAPRSDKAIDYSLALALTGLILFLPAIFMPIMTLDTMGLENTGSLFDGVISTWHTGYWFVAIVLALTSVVFPLLKLFLVFWISFHLKIKRLPDYLPRMMRIYIHTDEWGMLEVLMIGILVTIIKMHHMANIHYNTGFFCFIALMIAAVGSSMAIDKTEFWKQIERGRTWK